MPFRPKLVVEVRHGLGNRLRAYLAAAEVAARSGRALTLVWTPDAHCNATFDALFARPPGLCVRTALPPTEAGAAALFYDYMGARARPTLNTSARADVVVRSAYLLVADGVDTTSRAAPASLEARARRLRPSPAVAALLATALRPVRPPFVAVHLRTESDPTRDLPRRAATDASEVDAARATLQHRRRCQAARYAPAALQLATRLRARSVVVASDRAAAAHEHFAGEAWSRAVAADAARRGGAPPARVEVHPLRQGARCFADPRQAPCVQLAAAHMLALSRGRGLVPSAWSSFSEVVEWMGRFRATRRVC